MKVNWIDILKAKLDQREFKASQNDWSAMESLLDQSFPIDSSAVSSTATWKASLFKLGLFALLLIAPSQESLFEADVLRHSEIPMTLPNETEIKEEVRTEKKGIGSKSDEEKSSFNAVVNHIGEETHLGISSELQQNTSVAKTNKPLETRNGVEEQAVANSNSDASADGVGDETGETVSSYAFGKKSSVKSNAMAKQDELYKTEQQLESQSPLYLNKLELFPTRRMELLVSNSNLNTTSPLPLNGFSKNPNRSLWNKWNALNLQVLSDFNSRAEISLSAERAAFGGRIGLGLGFGTREFNYPGQKTNRILELKENTFWLQETSTQIQIDSTWRIQGINQGGWQVDTFYNVTIDSSLVTSIDSIWNESTVNDNQILSARYIELPFYYEKAWTKARWSLVAGLGGGFGWMNITGNTAELSLESQDFIRLNTEFRLGLDYAFHRDWSLGLRYRPAYVWYSDKRYDSNIQLDNVSLGLRFYIH